MRIARVLLVIVAVACFAVALSYPIRYYFAQQKNDTDMEQLAKMRQEARQGPEGALESEAVAGAPISRTDAPGESATAAADRYASAIEANETVALIPSDDIAPEEPVAAPDETEASTPKEPTTVSDETVAATPEEPTTVSDETVAATPEEPAAAPDEAETVVTDGPAEMPGETETVVSEVPAEVPGETETVVFEVPKAAPDGTGAPTPENPATVSNVAEAASSDGPTAAPDGTESVVSENPATSQREERTATPGNTVKAPDGREEEAFSGDAGVPMVAPEQPDAPTPRPTPTPEPTLEPNYWDLGKYYSVDPTPQPGQERATAEPTPAPTPTPDRSIRKGPLPYALKDKVVLDEAAILPEMQEIYALNHDLVGWINIPDTVIDYPVVQAEDSDFYLSHDFYGEENVNGQIILDALCDPYTPSYNLIVSGHHMKNGTMFGNLPEYRNKGYWEKHRFLEFDTLMARKQYVIFACFYSADYDEDEKGFRYNAVIDYKMDADRWLAEIEENQLYDTGIERAFGDEFITLTTCNRARHRNGRFVVVGRKVREGETFE